MNATDQPFSRFLARLRSHGGRPFCAAGDVVYSYRDLEDEVARRRAWLRRTGVKPRSVVAIRSDFDFEAIALMLALFAEGDVAALIPSRERDETVYHHEGFVEWRLVHDGPAWRAERVAERRAHPLLTALAATGAGGFVVFSSGSTGKPKAVLHSVDRFLTKFADVTKGYRTVMFLLWDHIAGMDTLFYVLASGGMALFPVARDPSSICGLIERRRAQVLPASPTFLRLLCLSGRAERFNLSSLSVITYGSEPMDEGTLERLRALFPGVRLIQKYGTSEFGSPPSMSEDGSLWMKIGRNGVEAKVVDGTLWIKTPSNMMGYLNADMPLMVDGWIPTGDAVDVRGDWLRILGRKSDLIIVGGEKVYPSEVEAALLEMPEIEDAVVYGERQPLIGHIVCARVRPRAPMDQPELAKRVRRFCRARLAAHKVPIRIEVAREGLTTDRQKKARSIS